MGQFGKPQAWTPGESPYRFTNIHSRGCLDAVEIVLKKSTGSKSRSNMGSKNGEFKGESADRAVEAHKVHEKIHRRHHRDTRGRLSMREMYGE